MTWYEVRTDSGIASERCYSKSKAIAKAEEMARVYGTPAKAYQVQVHETEIFRTGRQPICA